MPEEPAGRKAGLWKRTAAVLAVGAAIGIAGVLLFDFSLEATSSDEFCLGCHNHAIPYERYKLTAHYSNPAGVSAGCSDCHVQQEFVPKIGRKIAAAREVWGHVRGIIDTDEKYLAHQPEMKERELARFHASDSATCRSCHDVARMDLDAQSPKARRDHAKIGKGKTCVDCHEDAGHPLPVAAQDEEGGTFDF